MEQLEYWKKRCELAEMYIEESPCDPDITMSQLAAYSAWNHFKKLTIPVVVGTSFCETVECSNCGIERAYDGCIVCGEY
tara:strand:- start:1099 stop:1335 length:237 start_codon:yes stop_codon:yes gene_type:complete